MNAPVVRRALYTGLQFFILPYLLLMTLPVINYAFQLDYGWAEGLQAGAAALILLAFVVVCLDRPRWSELALVAGTLAVGILDSVFLWVHRERESTPQAGNPLWMFIVQVILTTTFGFSVLTYLILALHSKDEEGLTGDGDVALPEVELATPPRDVIGGHRTILYRWAGYLAALQATVTAAPLITLATAMWSPVRTSGSFVAIIIGIFLAFFIVTYGAFAVMRGPWSTATQDKFYLRAKLALLLSVAFTVVSAPFSFPRFHEYDFEVTPFMYFVWALSIAGAVGVLIMLGIIIRFERRRGIALRDDSDDVTLDG
ncbi:hypothetical protein CcaverHIS002_0401810 [Cutaneotrichosporon cavernicola]|uniref:Uncharacterized protein n=1 Tax=Cutaneotrichosporon cavernicola TaxID=279322 RepID=A0AA48L3L8_9TREE|nr:uncharacterized protein CcaverHIS019_0401760 [Cutaneotrichosporon cavernicola]BEI83577.1 hypothetical protein CcaverHIS002_0401810 [Cutaneotrichosporon cavernicola]BEI91356.1 hypothetical protein CcaverHIS019_0401760 [Cutaneotrichosporon cavernicola]BEI99129.1 hypothetical protein CcaverHIS631_0401720 [Cutaneotrichosporon cavernicola]BEJ06904.1 hypothetical protein CcaverHIS641_0401730 [Cutaneotrichosporon cavernicola]